MAFIEWPQGNVLWVAGALLITYFLFSTLHAWFSLRHVPGPILAQFSWLWILFATASGQNAQVFEGLAKRYGHLVRLGPSLLLTDDPELLKRMSAARSPYGKDGFYKATIKNPGHESMISTVDLALHDKIKSQLAGPYAQSIYVLYSGRESLAMEPIADGLVNQLVENLRAKTANNSAAGPKPVDLATIANYFTLDIITRFAFGREIGFLRRDEDVDGLMAAVAHSMKQYTIPISIPWLREILMGKMMMALFGPKPTDRTGLGAIMGYAKACIEKRYAPDAPDEKDLLGAFKRVGVEPAECLSESLVAMIAGSDTTAAAICVTLLHLLTSPRAYRKLKDVVRQAVREGTVSSPIKSEEAKKIAYIQAVVYEGMRMRSPVPNTFAKSVPADGDTIDGKFIPGGTAITGTMLPIMRDRRTFGEDADVFRPERFTEADSRMRSAMERMVELNFGYGRHRCAGQAVAFMELNKVYFELFRYFDFQLVGPQQPMESEIFTVWKDRKLMAQVTESSLI